nr:hypothetical protein [Tanacetum cinerariifolium]
PVWSENETLETTRKRMKWENDNYICRGHILNGMTDSLFDIYQNTESAKALWESLESKYMTEDASATKILGQYTQHNLMMDEAILVAVIIDKLPPSWKEFKLGLKHKKEELNLEMEPKIPTTIRTKESLKVVMINLPTRRVQITCWKCKKTGHMKKGCRSRKGNDGAGLNGSKDPEKQQG